MVCNVCYDADGHNGFCTLLSDLELQPVMVVDTDGVVSVVESLEVEGVEHKQILDACSGHERIYALLVFCHDGLLKTGISCSSISRRCIALRDNPFSY